jgi:crossover junction endodeoxyribonuclease RuvC
MYPALMVLGIDPGTAITGYGIIRSDGQSLEHVAYGTITTAADLPLPDRLELLYGELEALIRVHHPTQAAVEELFFAKNARTALSVGHARGVVLLALKNAGLPIYEYKPLQVKQAVTGYGRATKEQMQQMVRLLLELPSIPQPDDAADALAVAICHAHSYPLASRVSDEAEARRVTGEAKSRPVLGEAQTARRAT